MLSMDTAEKVPSVAHRLPEGDTVKLEFLKEHSGYCVEKNYRARVEEGSSFKWLMQSSIKWSSIIFVIGKIGQIIFAVSMVGSRSSGRFLNLRATCFKCALEKLIFQPVAGQSRSVAAHTGSLKLIVYTSP